MPRIVVSLVLAASFTLALAACSAESPSQKHPPQDPPDYKGVPTDMTPPSMDTPPSSKPQ